MNPTKSIGLGRPSAAIPVIGSIDAVAAIRRARGSRRRP